MTLFDVLLFGPPQIATAGFAVMFMALSVGIGCLLKRCSIEGAVWGFLILAASADLALFLSRTAAWPTSLFGMVTMFIAGLMISVLRFSFFQNPRPRQRLNITYISVLVFFAVVIWSGNILRPLPDAGFSSHHGWVPLYVQESFLSGWFLEIKDMAFGPGIATSLFYPADLLGLVAIAGWLGADVVYPAFNAASIVATILLFWVLSRSLHQRPLALILFAMLTVFYFTYDRFLQITLGGNWGDVMMYLSGGLICFYLVSERSMRRALLMAAVASAFLVFARHYGAFYSALIIGFGFLMSRFYGADKSWRPWFIVGFIWVVFSFRELYYLLGRFTVYYPGSWQADRVASTNYQLLTGALTDWGLITASDLSFASISLRGVYLLLLITTFWFVFRRGKLKTRRVLILIAPLGLFVLPLILQTVTGFRTNELYSKLYIIGIFIPAWYPGYLVTHVLTLKAEHNLWRRYKKPLMTVVVLFVMFSSWAVVNKISSGRWSTQGFDKRITQITDNKIVDRDMAETLKRTLSADDFEAVVNQPVMYFLYEPGASLRLYLGGRFFNDLDFWSERVLELSNRANSFDDLLKALDYPNLYISMMGTGKMPVFINDGRLKFSQAIESANDAIWLKRIITSGDARFYITKKSK